MNEEKPTIAMLLDIEHLYGEHEGRLGPIMAVLAALTVPTLFYVYVGGTVFCPLWLFVPFAVVIPLRVLMIFPGREKYRVAMFRKQLDERYSATESLMNIKVIHPDGCIEYVNGKICYLVCCFNGTSTDDLQRCNQVRKLCESMFGDFDFDIYLHNITDSPELKRYYDRVSNFERNTAARNFIKMTTHNINLTESTSVVQCTIYSIKARRSDWITVKKQIDSAIASSTSRCYKTIYRVDDIDAMTAVLCRNIDGVVNISELIRNKYANGHYGSSKVLAYDLPDDQEIVQGNEPLRRVIIDEAPSIRKHVVFDEDKNVQKVQDFNKEHDTLFN